MTRRAGGAAHPTGEPFLMDDPLGELFPGENWMEEPHGEWPAAAWTLERAPANCETHELKHPPPKR